MICLGFENKDVFQCVLSFLFWFLIDFLTLSALDILRLVLNSHCKHPNLTQDLIILLFRNNNLKQNQAVLSVEIYFLCRLPKSHI